MLSNLASYLGYSSAAAERTPTASITAEVRVRDEEDDWVLVEQTTERDRDTAQPSDADDELGITRVTLAISTYPTALPGSSKNQNRSVSLDVSCPLQESWYLTPPPSFSSEGPVHMETSPLENMLIEHPSMSVYERTSRGNSSSPSEEEPSPRQPSPSRLSRKEKLNKITRNKNAKLSKKVPKRVNEDGSCEIEEKTLKAKGPKVKELIECAWKSRRVPDVRREEHFDGMRCVDEEYAPEAPVVPPRKLYSEVLASKPEPSTVREPSEAPVSENDEREVPEPNRARAESESVMSVEDAPEEEAKEVEEEVEEESAAERPRAVQRMVDPQQRQNFLTRSAQKMKNLVEEPSASETDRSRPSFKSKGRKNTKRCIKF